MKNIDILKIKTSSKMGTEIGACLRDAICLAAKEWRNVEMKHNGKVYVINVNDLLGSVEEKGVHK